jgi:hypothetical protein
MTGYCDTWEWDGNNWTERKPTTIPLVRFGHAMAYDSARQRIVLFSGAIGPPASADDTWEWDGNNWTQRKPATIPLRRVGHALAYDAARQRILLFGGSTSLGTYGDTWEWDGKDWTQRKPTMNPIGRGAHKLVYDSVRQRVILFAGHNPTMLNDTWEWDGNNWIQQAPASSPSVRNSHAMAYDSARQRVVVFGGQVFSTLPDDETWEYGIAATAAAAGTPRPGGTVSLMLTAASDAGLFYQAGSSLGTGPIPVGNRRIGLSPDALLQVSAGNLWPWIFKGYRGTLDQRGQAAATIHIPNASALVGTRIHTAFVTMDPKAPWGIRSISPTVTITVTP